MWLDLKLFVDYRSLRTWTAQRFIWWQYAQLLKLKTRASIQNNLFNMPVLIFDQKTSFD